MGRRPLEDRERSVPFEIQSVRVGARVGPFGRTELIDDIEVRRDPAARLRELKKSAVEFELDLVVRAGRREDRFRR
jgi:hypothetical protein